MVKCSWKATSRARLAWFSPSWIASQLGRWTPFCRSCGTRRSPSSATTATSPLSNPEKPEEVCHSRSFPHPDVMLTECDNTCGRDRDSFVSKSGRDFLFHILCIQGNIQDRNKFAPAQQYECIHVLETLTELQAEISGVFCFVLSVCMWIPFHNWASGGDLIYPAVSCNKLLPSFLQTCCLVFWYGLYLRDGDGCVGAMALHVCLSALLAVHW